MPARGARVHSGGSLSANFAFGGAEETRTPDFLLAKEALYQLSYGPRRARSILLLARRGPTERGREPSRRYGPNSRVRAAVGASGLEPETSALSGQCSNQLS
jgi:hypothetical protein